MAVEPLVDTSDSSLTPPRPRRSERARSTSAALSSIRPPAGKQRKRVTLHPTVQSIPEDGESTDEEPGVDLDDSPSRAVSLMTHTDDVISDLPAPDPASFPSPHSTLTASFPVHTIPFSSQRLPTSRPSASSPGGAPSPRGSSPARINRRRTSKQAARPPQLSPATAEEYMHVGGLRGHTFGPPSVPSTSLPALSTQDAATTSHPPISALPGGMVTTSIPRVIS